MQILFTDWYKVKMSQKDSNCILLYKIESWYYEMQISYNGWFLSWTNSNYKKNKSKFCQDRYND